MELSERCIQTLEKEGFPSVYEWKDEPGTVHELHEHQGKVTIFITEGTVEITLDGAKHDLQTGDRLNIPPHVPHSAVLGCQYVVGEMISGDS
jgi:quercetin dioxygenase-like cupin family protein